MYKKSNLYLYLIPVVAVVAAFIVYISANNSDIEAGTVTTSESVTSNSTDTDTVVTTASVATLVVDPDRCRGCGKCVRIDSEHFTMSGGVAIVTSQENLTTSALTSAINSCEGNAISIEES